MRCYNCGKKMKQRKGRHHFLASGLPNVYLENVTIYHCSCGEEMPALPCLDNLLERISRQVVQQSPLLSGAEIRFLRKQLGLKSVEFALLLDVSKVTVSRWENDKVRIDRSCDGMIRALIISRDFRRTMEKIKRPARGSSPRPPRYSLDVKGLCAPTLEVVGGN